MKKNVVIVDDDLSLRELLEIVLKKEGYNVTTFSEAEKALSQIKPHVKDIDVVISDIVMPGMNGLAFLEAVKKIDESLPVIMITANTRMDYAVETLKHGAYDYITKPFKNDELKIIVKNAIEKRSLLKENFALKEMLQKEECPIVFKSKIMEEIYLNSIYIAQTDVPVLILGESGTGKELFAKLIHQKSSRKDEPFFAINCAAIPENLMESEFFGYDKGAFTGASYSKPGFFELANKGTLFLDEIGELPLSMQVKLLRAIEDKAILRLGSKEPFFVDIRIIAATNKNLTDEINNGRFREDLYYRLNVVKLNLPPLRERKEDILPLSIHFLRKFSMKNNKNIKGFTKDAIKFLENYRWPGNVRELQNVIERACVFETGEIMGLGSLPIEIINLQNNTVSSDSQCEEFTKNIIFENFSLDDYLSRIEHNIIECALKKAEGNKKVAAEMLGISLWALYHRLDKKQPKD